ncbi:MAG: transporter [Bacteroidetes bacterium]|nr:transporter [Bacteroidota bacterium]
MKKLIILISCSFLSICYVQACPFCGCGGGNLYMGLLPDFKHQFIGVRYHYAQYHTQLISDPTQFSTNYYNTIEIWGGLRLGEKFQLLAFIPYYQNKQIDDDGTTKPAGLGDITVVGQYQVFHETARTASRKLVDQQLWVGGGIKVPTGIFNVDVNDSSTTVADINAQLGTGSIDFLLNALYSLRVGNIGINVSANYKINTVNNDKYKYGNKFTGNLIAYYHIAMGKNAVSPNIGLGYENVAGNTLQSKMVQYTGSNITTAVAGVEFNFNKIGIGVNGQLPLAQNFAEGQTKLKFKGMMHVTFAL